MARVNQGMTLDTGQGWSQAAVVPGGRSYLQSVVLTFFILCFSLAILAVLAVVGLEFSYQDRIYPGVHVWGIDLSGMTTGEAQLALQSAFAYPRDAKVTFRDGNRTWSTTLADLGVRLDANATAEAAQNLGRDGNPIANLSAQAESWWHGYQVSPVVLFDRERATAYLNGLAAEINRPVEEATLTLNGTTVNTTSSQVGRELDVPATRAALAAPLQDPKSTVIDLVIHETTPKLADVSAAAQATKKIFSSPLTLISPTTPMTGTGKWTITTDQLAGLTRVQQVEGSNGARLEVSLDRAGLVNLLRPISDTIHADSQDARLIFDDDTKQLQALQPSKAGIDLDFDTTIDRIEAQATSDNHQVALAIKQTQPVINDQATAAQLGITGVVTQAYTTFAGSPPERITNIVAAAGRMNGVVIPPGEIFSFDKYLGDVSLDSGFAEALIIYNGKTIQGVGGGVCQVSTTAFRAAFLGGFPIVERNPHAYRVGYYEHVFGPGLDATVYSPLVDFKFKNDLSSYLLIETSVDKANSRLTFRFYGTSDNRHVQVGGPYVSNVVPHGPDIYEEDSSLPAGTIRKVDYAADGADVTVNRVVTKGGAITLKDTVFTRYEAWQAVYHYGPGTADIPTPVPTPQPTATATPTP